MSWVYPVQDGYRLWTLLLSLMASGVRSCRGWAFLFPALLLASACQAGSEVIAPPEIRFGVDACAHCRMIISDPRFAAGYVHEVADGRYESLVFDDIGDMLDHARDHADFEIVAWYVHDYASEEWLDATEAYYTLSHDISSPMAAGVAAHALVRGADEMAALHNGEVVDWSELQAMFEHGDGIGLSVHEHK